MKNKLSEQWCFLLFYEMILHPQQCEIQDASLIKSGENLQKSKKIESLNSVKFDTFSVSNYQQTA